MARVASWLRFAAPPSSTPLRRSRPRWGGAAGGNLPRCSLCFVGFLRGTEFLQLDSYCAQHSFWVTGITSDPSSWTLDWRLCCRHADDCAVFASSSCLIAALCTLLLFYTHTGRWVCELKGSKWVAAKVDCFTCCDAPGDVTKLGGGISTFPSNHSFSGGIPWSANLRGDSEHLALRDDAAARQLPARGHASEIQQLWLSQRGGGGAWRSRTARACP